MKCIISLATFVLSASGAFAQDDYTVSGNGQILWQETIPPQPKDGDNVHAGKLAVDATGIYLSGHEHWNPFALRLKPQDGKVLLGAVALEIGAVIAIDATGFYNASYYSDGRITKYDKTSGAVLWSTAATKVQAAYVDATYIYSGSTHGVTKIDKATGKVVWTTSLSDVGYSDITRIVADDTGVYVTRSDQFDKKYVVAKFSNDTGTMMWKTELPGEAWALAAGADSIYVGGRGSDGRGYISRFDRSNGSLKWTRSNETDGIVYTLKLEGDQGYSGGVDRSDESQGTLQIFSLADGTVGASTKIAGSYGTWKIVIEGNNLYVLGTAGKAFVGKFVKTTLNEVWRVEIAPKKGNDIYMSSGWGSDLAVDDTGVYLLAQFEIVRNASGEKSYRDFIWVGKITK